MDVEGYISVLNRYKYLGTDIRYQDRRILLEFSFTEELLNTYKIHSKYKHGQIAGEIAYKNVHKHVKKLESLGLIEQVERRNPKHGAIYYQITEAGMFQLFLHQSDLKIELAIALSVILNTHGNYSIFETFLYPCFKKETLAAIKLKEKPVPLGYALGTEGGTKYEITKLILEYLKSCCMEIFSYEGEFIRIINRHPSGSKPRKGLLAILDYNLAPLKSALVVKILLCLRQPKKIRFADQMNALSILAQDERFMKIAHDLQKDFKKSLDFAMHLRTGS